MASADKPDPGESMFRSLGAVVEETVRAADEASAADGRAGRGPLSTADAVPAGPRLGEDEEGRPQVQRTEGDVMVIKSLCVQCEEDGLTRLLLTRIPFFRDIILMAFACESCGYRNSEVQSAAFQERGCRYELHATKPEDLNRQVLKADRATVRIEELDFEIPPNTQKGVFTTVEGLLEKAIDGLASTQPLRRSLDPAGADAVEAFLGRLRALREGDAFPFTIVLDDPSGNSFMENPYAPRPDTGLRVRHYVRNHAQNEELGLFGENSRTGVDVSDSGSGGSSSSSSGDEAGRGGVDADGAAAAGGAGRPSSEAAGSAAAAGGAGAPSSAAAAGGDDGHHHGDHDDVDENGEVPWGQGTSLPAGSAADESGGGDESLRGSRAVTTMTPAVQAAAEAAAVAGGSAGAGGADSGGGTGSGSATASDDKDKHTGMGSGDGNVPGGWRKGGAMIHGRTERAAATDRARTGGPGAGSSASSSSGIGRGAGLGGLLSSVAAAAAAEEREVMTFPVGCPACAAAGECCMFVTDVPHFKEVILMSSRCEECGWRDVEVKGGGAVPPRGTVTTLRYDPASPHAGRDMTRDVIKGDTASIAIPELELQVEGGSLGGLYTTVEGLLTLIRDKLAESDPVAMEATDSGGAVVSERREAMSAFMKRLDACVAGTVPFTLVIKDPMANSWVYSPYTSVEGAPFALGGGSGGGSSAAGATGGAGASGDDAVAVDPFLSHADYVRSEGEDIELGLADMQTEGYGETEPGAEGEGEKEKAEGKEKPGQEEDGAAGGAAGGASSVASAAGR